MIFHILMIELKKTIFKLNKQLVEEFKEKYPSLQDDDILLYILDQFTELDSKAIAICLGAFSTHVVNQRRYRMKERMKAIREWNVTARIC